MPLSSWIVVAGYVALVLAVGLYFARRAARSTEEYFLSGRTLPWWIIGTSMVVTTFAPDTPPGVAEYTRTGVYNNWFGWHMVMGQILAAVLFARLWRRSGVMTDNELLEIRYDGRPAAGLRIFKALHFSLVYNLITLAVVIGAMVEVIAVVAEVDRETARWVIAGVALLYCVLAGFWGVVATDFIQFWIALGGTVIFAVLAARQVGGIEAVARAAPQSLQFWPSDPGDRAKILVYMCVMWWGHANADGGGYLIQRMLAAKDERHASLGTLWFSIAYAGVRVWPWILVGSLSLVVIPAIAVSGGEVAVNGRAADRVTGRVIVGGVEREVRDLEVAVAREDGRARVTAREGGAVVESLPGKRAYPTLMKVVLAGRPLLLGVLVAAFLAAFMSTVDTHLNWGASYLVNDVFRRFLWPGAPERALVAVAKAAVVGVMALAVLLSRELDSIKDAWIFAWAISAGIGPFILLRWFWWRVNAWSEICALATSLLTVLAFELLNAFTGPGPYRFAASSTWVFGVEFAKWERALIIVGLALVAGLVATFVTRPVGGERLARFLRLVRPPGAWGPVRRAVGASVRPDHSVRQILLLWVLGISVVYGFTFAVGGLIYGRGGLAAGSAAVFLAGSVALWRKLRPTRRRS